MNIETIVGVLGWTLLHFLWQGALVAVVYGLVRAGLPAGAVGSRYLAGCGAMVAFGLLPVITLGILCVGDEKGGGVVLVSEGGRPALPVVEAGVREGMSRVLEMVVFGWAVGALGLGLRLGVGWCALGRLLARNTRGIETLPGVDFERLCARMGVVQRVQLRELLGRGVPMVVGWMRPVILLPSSSLLGLSPRQLEFILAHELAHIRRQDYLANLVQTAIETVLFYHPAVWWVSRAVRTDRELCCDVMAVEVVGDPVGYARALTVLEELRVPAFAMAATGGSLLDRVSHVLGVPGVAGASFGRVLARWLGLLGLGLLCCAVAYRYLVPERYRVETLLEWTEAQRSEGEAGRMGQMQRLAAVATSERVLRSVVAEVGTACARQGLPAVSVEEVRQGLRVRGEPGSVTVAVGFEDRSRERAGLVVERVAAFVVAQANEVSDRGRVAVAKIGAEVDRVRVEANRLLGELGWGGPQTEAEYGALQRERLGAMDREIEAKKQQMRRQGAVYEAMAALSPQELPHALATHSQIASLIQARAELEQQVAGMAVDLSENHPDREKLTRKLKAIEIQLDKATAVVMGQLSRETSGSERELFQLQELREQLSSVSRKQENMRRNYWRARAELESLERLLAEAESRQRSVELERMSGAAAWSWMGGVFVSQLRPTNAVTAGLGGGGVVLLVLAAGLRLRAPRHTDGPAA